MTPQDLFEPLPHEAILNALGLARFSYYFFEAYDDQLLRALKVTAGRADSLLEPWTLTTEQAEALSSPEYPVFLTRHSGYRLPVQSIDCGLSLLEEILPYPFAQMCACARTEAASAFSVSPQGLLWSLKRFTAAFAHAERILASSEFACLTITGELMEIHLLTQHVGRKRILIASLPPERVGELEAIFNNRCFRATLSVSPQSTLIGQLDHLVLALPTSFPISDAAFSWAPDPDLRPL